MDLMRVSIERGLTRGSSTPANDPDQGVRDGPHLVRVRNKNLSLQAVGNGSLIERHAWAVGVTTLGFPSEIEQATAVRMVYVAPRESGLLGRGSGCRGDSKALSPGRHLNVRVQVSFTWPCYALCLLHYMLE